MIHAHGELVGVGDNLRRGGISSRAERAVGLIRKGVASQKRRNGRVHGDRQSVVGESRSVDAVSFRGGGHGEDLRRAEDLPETLILSEVKGVVPAVVDAGEYHRPAVGNAKFVACEWRDAPRINIARMIEIIPRVKRRIAHKLKSATVDLAGAGLVITLVNPAA